MTIKSRDEMLERPIEIDLTGSKGNVFYLMALAAQYAKQLGLDGDAIRDDMVSADYEHAIEVFERNFGDFVTLYR